MGLSNAIWRRQIHATVRWFTFRDGVLVNDGRLLTDSGWTNIISEAGVATGSESLLYASRVMKTRHAHSNFTFIGALTKRSNERRKCH